MKLYNLFQLLDPNPLEQCNTLRLYHYEGYISKTLMSNLYLTKDIYNVIVNILKYKSHK